MEAINLTQSLISSPKNPEPQSVPKLSVGSENFFNTRLLQTSHIDISSSLADRSIYDPSTSFVVMDNQELGVNNRNPSTSEKKKIAAKKLAMFLTGEAFLWDKAIGSIATLLPEREIQQTVTSATVTSQIITSRSLTLTSTTSLASNTLITASSLDAGNDWIKLAQSLVGLATNSATLAGTLTTQLPILGPQIEKPSTTTLPSITKINAVIKLISQSALWLSPFFALFPAIGIPTLGVLNLARCASGLGIMARSFNITATLIDIMLNKKDVSALPERLKKLLTSELTAAEKIQLNDMLRLLFKETLNVSFLSTQIAEFCQGASSKVIAKVYLLLIALNHAQLVMKAYSLASTTMHSAINSIKEPLPADTLYLTSRASIISIPSSFSRAASFERM